MKTIGSGVSETGPAKVGVFDTVVRRRNGGLIVEGRKFYTTGSLFADYIHLSADDETGGPVTAAVPARAPGVTIVDDWDGFGQALTASGTATFEGVALDPALIKAAAQGRLPRGYGVSRLVDLPPRFEDQWRALGLARPT